MDCTKSTISRQYYWSNLWENTFTHIKVCKTSHKNNKQNLKYGKLPSKEVEAIPWNRLSVHLISPYKLEK